MKKITLLICLLLTNIMAKAQCEIPLMTFIYEPQNLNVPLSSLSSLEAKLAQAISSDGIIGGASFSQFSVIAQVNPVQEETTGGLRVTYTTVFDLDLFVGNNSTKEKIFSTTIRLTGAGTSKQRAYTTAFNSLTNNRSDIIAFVRTAKQKIMTYYEKQTPYIITQAKGLASRNQFEEALTLLASVPVCCSRYAEIEDIMSNVFRAYLKYDCASKINKARAIWNATQNRTGAAIAGAYLAAVDPSSDCNNEVAILSEQIRSRIGEEWDLSKELTRRDYSLEEQRIEAARAIGVAFGTHQKSDNIRENWIVR